MDGGAWRAAVHGVAKGQTRLSDFFHFSLWCVGEGNGSPLQCSCLENPRDGGAWWAAVYGVTQSRTGLKWLCSSSSSKHTSLSFLDFPEHWVEFPELYSSFSLVIYFVYVRACAQMLSHVWFFVTAWIAAHQAPLSMRCFRQEYWSGVPCPPGDLPDAGIETSSLTSLEMSGGFFTTSATWEAHLFYTQYQ